jgi:hypothetical protein
VQVHWLIETGVFPNTAARVTHAIEARSSRWSAYFDGIAEHALPPVDAPVIFWGALGSAYGEQVAKRWRPGAIGDVTRFECSAYLRGLPEVRFANSDAVFTTVADLVAAPEKVLADFAQRDQIFVRPNSALKPFSGRQLAVPKLSLAALDHGFYYDDENLAIVVSTPKRVAREWRFVIGDGDVIAGCEYEASRHGVGNDVPTAVTDVARQVANAAWQAAPLYVVDIGEVDGALCVMELNPFSGADLYYCDAPRVVDIAARIAQRLFGRGNV